MAIRKVLIAEDSLAMRQALVTATESLGHVATEAVDGVDALSKAKADQYDLMLIDVNMPKLDGLSLISSLREMPLYKKTPMIVITTESSAAKKDAGRESGATGWLTKPFMEETLLDIITKYLS